MGIKTMTEKPWVYGNLVKWFEAQGFTVALHYKVPCGFGRPDLFAVKGDLKYVVEIKEESFCSNGLVHGVGQALFYRFVVPNSVAVLATYERVPEPVKPYYRQKRGPFQPILGDFCESLGVKLLLCDRDGKGWKWFAYKKGSV
jgi:hypothetical protein